MYKSGLKMESMLVFLNLIFIAQKKEKINNFFKTDNK